MADTPTEGSGADDKSADEAPKTDYEVTGDETEIEKAEREEAEAAAKKSKDQEDIEGENAEEEGDEDEEDVDAEDDEDEENAEDDDDQDDDDDEEQSEDEDESDESTRKKRRGGFQKKIDRLEAEIERLNKQLTEKSYGRPVDPFAPEPKRQDFRTDQEFQDAHSDWRADQREAARQTEARTEDFKKSQKAKVERYETRYEEMRKDEEYAKAIDSYEGPFTNAMGQALIDSDYGPEIALHIAKNPEIGSRMAGMTLIEINKEVAKLELKISESQGKKAQKQKSRKSLPKKKSGAPRPIEPVKGTTKVKVDPDDEPYEDYLKKRQKRRGY